MTTADSLPPLDAGAVRRYVLDTWGNCMIEHGEGPYVLHADHVAAIEKLAEERAALARKVLEWEAREIEVCPEDVEFEAVIAGLTRDRDKALADLVAVRAELAEANVAACEVGMTLGAVVDERDAARAELARLRMEQDGMCSAEELRQARAERDAHANEENYLDAELQRVRAELERVREALEQISRWDNHCATIAKRALATTPPTRSAEC